jgi:hypothetical protein
MPEARPSTFPAQDAARATADPPAWRWLRAWRSGEADDVRVFLDEIGPLPPDQVVAVLLV